MPRKDAVLAVIGEAPAGAPFDGAVTPGTAVKIATGGVVPAGADRIVMQEIVEQGRRHNPHRRGARRSGLHSAGGLRLRRRRGACSAPARS